jgi:hypothetical protein
MRLINSSFGDFEEFLGQNIPSYAILSHTWEKEEVSFQDMDQAGYQSKKGFHKIANTCRLARQAGIEHAWVDTCCIDKSSSAELTEAINSMFRWYQRSTVCYVYLSDLAPGSSLKFDLPKCRWFTRGWTLQELIAPKEILFFDREWNMIGTKQELVDDLARITGIDTDVLRHERHLSAMSVAQRMSWAAKRNTTRTEDTAYCLLGIFDVNMPLLYGEDDKAFTRLQENIMRTIPDFSIFAWKSPAPIKRDRNAKQRHYSGVLATSPREFIDGGSLTVLPNETTLDFSFTNQGIKIGTPLLRERILNKQAFRYIFAVCRSASEVLAISLRQLGPGQFIREDPSSLSVMQVYMCAKTTSQSRFLLTHLPSINSIDEVISNQRVYGLQICLPEGLFVEKGWPWMRWDDEDHLFFLRGDTGEGDCAAVNIKGRIGTRGAMIPIECMFFALNWAQTKSGRLHSTIFDPRLHSNAASQLIAQLTDHDKQRYRFIDDLIGFQIPQFSQAFFEHPKSELGISISYTATMVQDRRVCQRPFWRVQVSSSVCHRKDRPQPKDARWKNAHEEVMMRWKHEEPS